MGEPIPGATNASEIGETQNLSQASACSPANENGRLEDVPPQFVKLRHYVWQMRGMILDTEA